MESGRSFGNTSWISQSNRTKVKSEKGLSYRQTSLRRPSRFLMLLGGSPWLFSLECMEKLFTNFRKWHNFRKNCVSFIQTCKENIPKASGPPKRQLGQTFYLLFLDGNRCPVLQQTSSTQNSQDTNFTPHRMLRSPRRSQLHKKQMGLMQFIEVEIKTTA